MLKTRGKEQQKMLENGQKLTPEIGANFLKQDLVHAMHTFHVILEDPEILKAVATAIIEKSKAEPVQEAKKILEEQKHLVKKD